MKEGNKKVLITRFSSFSLKAKHALSQRLMIANFKQVIKA